jgi:predicted Fe-Mo cluster-binding NifX family protein
MNKNTVITIGIAFILMLSGGWVFFGSKRASAPAPDPDRIVVSSVGPAMNSQISEVFGRAQYFIIYNLKRKSFFTVENPYLNEAHAVGLRIGAMLKDKRVGIVICKNIGPEPVKKFNSCGIRAYIGATGTVSDGIMQFMNDQLILTTKPNVPSHYGLPGQAPCPNVPGQPNTRIENPMLPIPDAAAPGQQAALRVSVPQWNARTVTCPACKAVISIPDQDPATRGNVMCPACGNILAPGMGDTTMSYAR